MSLSCPVYGKCGGCQYLDLSYEEQLRKKEDEIRELFKEFEMPILPIEGAEPYHYRCKVQMSFQNKDSRHLLSGTYAPASHQLVPVDDCLLDDERADVIIRDIRLLMEKFKLQAYDEKRKTGVLRHVMVRVGKKTGEVMVILVTGSSLFPGKQNFVRELRKQHPEITTIIQNINSAYTSMVLGDSFQTIYGPGFIYDELSGKRFRLSPGAFFQVNPPQAEKLFSAAMELADLQGTERVLDAYCGTGTIGILASDKAKEVVGIELNAQAVQDARKNAAINKIENIRFYQGDAGDFLLFHDLRPDVVIMDPPRTGSSEAFLSAVIEAAPEKIVYISCGPDTQARDMRYLVKNGYHPGRLLPFDLFPWTEHIETVCLLSKLSEAKNHISVKVDMDEMDLTAAESKATYQEIQDWVQQKYGFHVSHLNIAKTKHKCGIIERQNYNLPKTEDSRSPETPKEKEEAIIEAFKAFQMIKP